MIGLLFQGHSWYISISTRALMRFLKLFLFLILAELCLAQNQQIDSLKFRLSEELPDTTRVKILARLGFEYSFVNSDSARQILNQSLELAEYINFPRGKADALNNIGISYDIQGDYQKSLKYMLEALSIYESINYATGKARGYNNAGMVYYNLNDVSKSLEYHLKSLRQEQEIGDSIGIAYSMIHVGELYRERNQIDSSFFFFEESLRILTNLQDEEGLTYVYNGMGSLYLEKDDFEKAREQYLKAYSIHEKRNNKIGLAETSLLLGNVMILLQEKTVALEYYHSAFNYADEMGAINLLRETTLKLAEWHEDAENYSQSLNYFKEYSALKDSLINKEKLSELAKIQSDFDLLEKEKEIELISQEKDYQRTLIIIFLVLIFGIIVTALVFYRNYLLKSKAYLLLERKKAEVERKNLEIEAEKKNALQATEAKAKFLSSMSHEIRTPLNAIIGISQLLNDKTFDEDQAENLKALRFSAENLMVMVNDILDFSKIEANKVEYESIPFDLHELLQNISLSFSPKAQAKSIHWKASYENDVPKIIVGDPGKLIQVLTNLVNNAIKFTAQGGVELKVTLLDKNEAQVSLQFAVIDTGMGIPKEHQASILDPFSQADNEIHKQYGGSGLGLTIVKRLLENQGSAIEFESDEGKGSRFFFDLEFGLGGSKTQIAREHPSFKSLKGVKLLLVEDNKINEMLVVKVLTSWDVSIDVASNGIQALEMIQLKDYDLVLMDLLMPEMDGIEAAQRIRGLDGEKYKHLPIIALTATATLEAREKVMKAGMNDYISKPFDISQLYRKLEDHLIGKDIRSLWGENTN